MKIVYDVYDYRHYKNIKKIIFTLINHKIGHPIIINTKIPYV